VSKLTTDVVSYCTEASNQKNQNMRTGKHCFTKKALIIIIIIRT